MTILHNVSQAIKNNAGKYVAKGLGAAGLGVVCYDSDAYARLRADYYAGDRDSVALDYYLNNTQYDSSMSVMSSKVKELALDCEINQNWRRFFNLGIGYVQGFTSMLISNVIPLGLSLGALLTKGIASKVSAGALAVFAVANGVKDFFGLGNPPSALK